jgi:hypothetical protein
MRDVRQSAAVRSDAEAREPMTEATAMEDRPKEEDAMRPETSGCRP